MAWDVDAIVAGLCRRLQNRLEQETKIGYATPSRPDLIPVDDSGLPSGEAVPIGDRIGDEEFEHVLFELCKHYGKLEKWIDRACAFAEKGLTSDDPHMVSLLGPNEVRGLWGHDNDNDDDNDFEDVSETAAIKTSDLAEAVALLKEAQWFFDRGNFEFKRLLSGRYQNSTQSHGRSKRRGKEYGAWMLGYAEWHGLPITGDKMRSTAYGGNSEGTCVEAIRRVLEEVDRPAHPTVDAILKQISNAFDPISDLARVSRTARDKPGGAETKDVKYEAGLEREREIGRWLAERDMEESND